MTQTPPTLLVVVGTVGGMLGWFAELALVAAGLPVIIPPLTLGVAAGLIGILLILLAIPVFRVARTVPGATVDPFYATRVVLLAKASSLAGALASGLTAAVLVFLLTRAVMPAVGSITASSVATAGALILLVGGLVAERMCTLPPEDDGNKETGL